MKKNDERIALFRTVVAGMDGEISQAFALMLNSFHNRYPVGTRASLLEPPKSVNPNMAIPSVSVMLNDPT